KRITKLPLDIHLMIAQPERYLEAFAEAGADVITFHAEATAHVHRGLEIIRQSGARAGLAVNPLTPLSIFREALPYMDMALVMSVDPGFGGQKFIESSLRRLVTLADWRQDLNPSCEIEIDGGINRHTAPRVVEAGATVLVAGSAIFSGLDSIRDNMRELRAALRSAEHD
ncbi:MAG TPA: ribulose-phosphate 3-epimerase, partial [Trueperaceae bacterium]